MLREARHDAKKTLWVMMMPQRSTYGFAF